MGHQTTDGGSAGTAITGGDLAGSRAPETLESSAAGGIPVGSAGAAQRGGQTPPGGARTAGAARDEQAGACEEADGRAVRDALLAGAVWLAQQAERVNALNVFPVPDGDTGTNLFLTVRAAEQPLRALPDDASVGAVASTAAEAVLLGARGNSGVILSQWFRGAATALRDRPRLSCALLGEALTSGSAAAYRAVGHPVEGTILTAMRRAAEVASEDGATQTDLLALLRRVQRTVEEAVQETPAQLDVLRRAGVVDAGAEGFRVLLEAVVLHASGQPLDEQHASATAPHMHADLHAIGADSGAELGFCTEFLLREPRVAAETIRCAMEDLGTSVLVIVEEPLLRVHVHTTRPGRALEYAVDAGTVVSVKVENMTLQAEAFLARSESESDVAEAPAGRAPGLEAVAGPPFGIVAVAAGDGLRRVLESLGASVVEGGQSMNPSVGDLVAAVERVGEGGGEVVLLPDNRNVLMAAQQVQQLAGRTVRVVPTTSVPQGIAALLAVNYQADVAENLPAMEQAARMVRTLEVTSAIRDAVVEGVSIARGEGMALLDGRLVAKAADPSEALAAGLAVAVPDAEVATIYVGDGGTAAEAQSVAGRLRERWPDLAIEVVEGGQPLYPYVASVE